MQKRKQVLFISFFVILLFPFLNGKLHLIKSGQLQGYFTNADDVDFSWDKWFDATFAKNKSDYINDHFGFREDFVRLSGQIDFTLFTKVDYGSAVISKDHNLYYDNYIDDYIGKDFMGYDTIAHIMKRVKAIQDTLSHLGKSLIVVYVPSKAFYNAESMPEIKKCYLGGKSNYSLFLKLSDSLHINNIDLNSWFISLKGKTQDSLFTKQGIHWTWYGAFLGGDSIAKYIEKLKNISLPHPTFTKIEHTTKAKGTDNDMATILNLALPVANETFSYPEATYDTSKVKQKLNIIFIGDSFVWTTLENGFMSNVYKEWQFWFYNKEVFYNKNNPHARDAKMENYDWKKAIEKTDCIVLMNTTASLKSIGSGFIDNAYEYYYPRK